MNYEFKGTLAKSWSITDDGIIYNKKNIKFSQIQNATISDPGIIATGFIDIIVSNKPIRLFYMPKDKENGRNAFEIICENKADISVDSTKKSMAAIQDELNSLPYIDTWGTKKEIAELPNILEKDEHIMALTSGMLDGNTWLLVCTNKRIVLLDKGMFYGLKMIEIPLNKINSISHTKGLLMGKIFITDGAGSRHIEMISNDTISFFVDTINEQMELFQNKIKNNSYTNTTNTPQISVADEILKFKQLLDIGAITEEEFNKKKSELLQL